MLKCIYQEIHFSVVFIDVFFELWIYNVVIQNGVKPFLNETVKKSWFPVDLLMLKYILHFQCSVDNRNRVKMNKILEKKCFGARFYFSPTWPIYNQWLDSLAQ